jgi:metallophosphoesterase superfamily enzyme
MDRIGSITYRVKTYLSEKGYPVVNELHLGFESEYQGRGYFQDALIELLKYDDTPIYASKHRVINALVFKAINKLDKDIFDISEIEDFGYVIKLK